MRRIFIALAAGLLFAAGCTSSPQQRPPPASPKSVSVASPGATAAPPNATASPKATVPPPRPTAVDATGSPTAESTGSPAIGATRSPALIRAHGVVRGVEKANLIIVIEHEAIDGANLPHKTTRFTAKSYEVVTDVGPGDEVDFDLERDAKGGFVVVDAVPMAR